MDSNDAHAQAWVRAFSDHGHDVSFDRVRRLIGMGGDKLMPRVSSISADSDEGRRIADRRKEIFARDYLPRLRPFRESADLVAALKDRGYTVVAASSAKRDELEPLLDIAGATMLLDETTSSDDAEESKPAPDIVEAALGRAGSRPETSVMIGDTPYDIEAAARAGVAAIAFRTGGWRDEDLRGAIAVYDGPWDLLAHLDGSPLGGIVRKRGSDDRDYERATRA